LDWPVVLSDRTIRRLIDEGHIGIEPFDEELIQPSSVDVRVDRFFRVFRNSRYPFIDVKEEMEDLTELVETENSEPFILHPGEFVLGSTLERITLPDDLVARL
jgi:dCTP deaminase